MNKEKLLEEAKRRYPVGTKLICLFDNDEYEVLDFDNSVSESEVWFNSTDLFGICVYRDGTWAKRFDLCDSYKQYTKEDVVEFANYAIRETWNPTTIEESKTTTELFDLWVKSKQETK